MKVIKFFNVAGINCCESKKSQKVTLHGLHLKGSFEWNPQWYLSLTIFLNSKPVPASGYCQLLPKSDQEFERM